MRQPGGIAMSLIFQPMDEVNARALIDWRYEPPYDFYNIPASAIENLSFFVDPHNAYYSISREDGTFEAFCCFGADAQVPGGDYTTDALDVGWGMHPNLIGQGHGSAYVASILTFGQQTFAPARLRTTVAEFNIRSRRVCEKVGFHQVQVFSASADGMRFIILTRDV
jgi:RimJ/RimL family protein N-acetyltransferase